MESEAATAERIVRSLQNAGFEAVWAGGAVRDRLLGLSPHDIDIATSALPEQVETLFRKTVAVGKQFGVILVVEGDFEFEVATFREDGRYSDGRRPEDVSYSDMQADASRRDLTINALFYDPVKEEIHDFVGGKKDLEEGRLRFVGDPQGRIEEDKLRMLRAVRFAARFRFSLDEEAKHVIRNYADEISLVSRERVKAEIDKMLLCEQPSAAFTMLKDLELLVHVLPEIDLLWGCEHSKKWHSEGDVAVHSLMVLDNCRGKTDDTRTLWAALLHDVGKPHSMETNAEGEITNHGHDVKGAEIAGSIMRRLKASNEDRKLVVLLVRDHIKSLEAKNMKKSTLRRLIAESHFDQLMVLSEADVESSIPLVPGKGITKRDGIDYLKEFAESVAEESQLPPPLITGKDLLAMGLEPGPQFGLILNEISNLQLEGEIHSAEEAKAVVRRIWNGEKKWM